MVYSSSHLIPGSEGEEFGVMEALAETTVLVHASAVVDRVMLKGGVGFGKGFGLISLGRRKRGQENGDMKLSLQGLGNENNLERMGS